MKNIGQKLGVAILTFIIGIATVLLIDRFYNSEGFTIEDKSDLENAVVVTIAPKPPRFTETFQSCGLGCVFQSYVTNDGIELSETYRCCKNPKNRDKKIVQKDDEKIVSKIETDGKTYYEIYLLENEHCIYAPTIELGIEFEKWQSSQK